MFYIFDSARAADKNVPFANFGQFNTFKVNRNFYVPNKAAHKASKKQNSNGTIGLCMGIKLAHLLLDGVICYVIFYLLCDNEGFRSNQNQYIV